MSFSDQRIAEIVSTVVSKIRSYQVSPDLDRAAIVGIEAAETYLDHDPVPTSILVRSDPAYVDDVMGVLAATVTSLPASAVLSWSRFASVVAWVRTWPSAATKLAPRCNHSPAPCNSVGLCSRK